MFKDEIPIFFSIDDNYVPFFTVAAHSIMDNASKEYNYKFIILNDGLEKTSEEKLKKLEDENFKIEFVNVNEKIKSIENDLSFRLRDYYTNSIYYRIFIPSLFKNYDKALYLDADITVVDDISKLYFEDIGDNMLGVITDGVVNADERLVKYTKEVVGADEGMYFNSGILVMNLKKLREEKIEEKFIYLLSKYNFDTVAPDQDYLNFLCKGSLKYIHIGWDRMPVPDANFDDEDLHLIHYNMFQKPWKYDNVMYEEYFWKYAKKTEYYNDLMKIREGYSDEQKMKDAVAAEEMVQHALKIIDDRKSFAHVVDTKTFGGFSIK